MKRTLLQILGCPQCHGELTLEAAVEEGGEIVRGALRCPACAAAFPVEEGVPRLIPAPEAVRPTKTGFEYQWFQRLRGWHEPRSQVYGFPTREFIGWLMSHYGGALADGGGRWILDAGCGSAEKAAELARLHPRDQVVGMDLSGTLPLSRRENAAAPNLHFVQGDVHHPPFRHASIDYVMSIGVFHHTSDTRRAFDAVTDVLKPGAGMALFLYPAIGEDPFWTSVYRQRDQLFLGRAHQLPRPLLMALCHAWMALTLLPSWLSVNRQARQRHAELTFLPLHQNLLDFYKAGVFLSFDNLMPPFQHRHARDEVVGWYRSRGFTDVEARFPGFFFGRRAGT